MASATDTPTTTESLENSELEIAEIDGGALVYEVETEYRPHLGRDVVVCRTLAGFATISDRKLVRAELRKRGHGVGAIHQLPRFDL